MMVSIIPVVAWLYGLVFGKCRGEIPGATLVDGRPAQDSGRIAVLIIFYGVDKESGVI